MNIVTVNKDAETVTLKNVSSAAVDLTRWRICSITGNQLHATLSGSLAPGDARSIPSQAGAPIWNNTSDPGALYDANGSLVSYWGN